MASEARIRDLELIHRIVEAARDGEYVSPTDEWTAEHIDYNVGLAIEAGLVKGTSNRRWQPPRYDFVEPTNDGHDFLAQIEKQGPAWWRRALAWAGEAVAKEGLRSVIRTIISGGPV